MAPYTLIIDDILRASDLNTITAKRIRKGLQERVTEDISVQKVVGRSSTWRSRRILTTIQDEITALIMKRFDKLNNEKNGSSEASEPVESIENGSKTANGDSSDVSHHKRSPSDSALSELEDSAPPKKKTKKAKPTEDEDAAFARKLQAEENSRSGRATRGGNTKKRAAAPKKKSKVKSKTKIKDDDDSDIASGSGAEKKSPSRKGGFHVRPQKCVTGHTD